ncbi:MAG: hemerythrin cation-binding region [Proteobacteria bacterium]|jgi:hemerythrin-like domain-containing protein|nr:hemerythrin cation-binding region [Pseudomonadota bacterium]MBS1214363.1 hemerythrin cation-binding region [Pseudomonadota bacterium]
MLNTALTIIQDEHRSLAAVVHGLKYLVHEARSRGINPDFKLLWAMIYYIDAFPEKLHHPKENAYLFRRLRMRTREADAVLDELEKQHTDGARNVRALEVTLGHYEAGAADGFEQFAAAVNKFGDEIWEHMNLEEKVIIPLAKKYLTAQDWVDIAEAFGENGDPRFGSEPDHEFRDLFSRIVNLAPPPIGVGPSHQ